MTTACPRAPREEKKNSNNKLILRAKTRIKSNITRNEYTKCIYFGLKHKRFSNRIHPLG